MITTDITLSLKDRKLKFQHLIHYYSDFLFKFLKKYYKELSLNMSILDIITTKTIQFNYSILKAS